MEHKLCWMCKEEWGPYKQGPWAHCHHSEPEIKPKPLCWCDEPTFCYVLVGENTLKAEFCPVCGKKREEWGK